MVVLVLRVLLVMGGVMGLRQEEMAADRAHIERELSDHWRRGGRS